MIIRSHRSVVMRAGCAWVLLLLVALPGARRAAEAKNPNVTTGVHLEGTVTLTFYDGILEELGWNVPSGVERVSDDQPPQYTFSILPTPSLANHAEKGLSDRGQHMLTQDVITTRGAFIISNSDTYFQISRLIVNVGDDKHWYVTASISGKMPPTIEFDFLPDSYIENDVTKTSTATGDLCLSENSATVLGVSRYQGTCFARLTVESELIGDEASTRWSMGRQSKTTTSKIAAVTVISCTTDADCPVGRTCDLMNGTCREGVDLIVKELQSFARLGRDATAGITSYAIGTVSCNIGDMPAHWNSSPDTNDPFDPFIEQQHPVIAQNVYRYNEEQRDGNGIVQRPSNMEQIGMSWVKHGFEAGTDSLCAPAGVFCDLSAGPDFLGPNCSDVYSSGLNGFQRNLGPRYEVNPVTGLFTCWDSRDRTSGECPPAPDLCFPCSSLGDTLDGIKRRVQIHDNDLIPALNPDSRYLAEGHYVTFDDALVDKDNNNMAYREFALFELAPLNFNFLRISATPTQDSKPAIQAWQDFDPTVDIQIVDVVNDGRFLVAAKATDMGDGTWHYEYAVLNMNSDRSGQAFTVPIPMDATVLSTGFHDIDSHSGSPYSSADWALMQTSGSLAWSTDTQDVNPLANALRWGTTYNFRLITDTCPTIGNVTLGLFKPFVGDPDSVLVSTIVPGDCATCEAAMTLNAADPMSGFVDVLQPTELDGSNPTGIQTIDFSFNNFPNCITPAPGDYQVSQLGGMGVAPTPVTTDSLAVGMIRVALSGPVNPGARTTITHSLSGSESAVGFLPGDADRNGTTNLVDLTALVSSLDTLALPLSDSDMDRDGSTNTQDLLRLIDLLQGAGVYEAWDGRNLP